MAKLPDLIDPTLSALDQTIVEHSMSTWRPRPYYGASGVGHSCERRGWLSFRWASIDVPDAMGTRRIDDGHRGEEYIAGWLRRVPGITLETHGEDGRQGGFVDIGGHFRGHWDGLITGLLQAPVTKHVWECKIVGDKPFQSLTKAKIEHGEKAALARWDAVYYAQAQVYMHYAGADRHYLTAGSPGARTIQSVRTDYDAAVALRLVAKARRVIFSPRPPAKVSEDPAWYECGFCPHRGICHEQAFPLANCRTCMHSTPLPEGGWRCDRHAITIDEDVQRDGCPYYLYHPDLVPGEQTDAGPDWVEYRMPDSTVWRNEATPQLPAQGAQP